MTKQEKIDKMKRAGFTVVHTMAGNWIAYKSSVPAQSRRVASSVTELHKLIYGY